MVLLQTEAAIDLGGGEITCAIQRHQVMAVQINEASSTLSRSRRRNTSRHRARGIDRIEDGPHLEVTGDVVDAIDGADVVIAVAAAMIEGQPGRVFERENRDCRHQDIRQAEFILARPRVRYRTEVDSPPFRRVS